MMETLHFMPDAAVHMRGKTEFDANTIQMGADRLRAAIDGMHPGSARWPQWSAGRMIRRTVLDQAYVEPEGTATFLAGALMCCVAGMPRLTGKFAYVEALYAGSVMARRPSHVGGVCDEVLGMRPGRDGDSYMIPVPQYLRMAVGLGRTWKLVNQAVQGGMVGIHNDEFVRLLQDSVVTYIRERVDRMRGLGRTLPDMEIPPDIIRWCDIHTTQHAGDVPPCVQRCRDVMDGGENLPHAGRFLTATYFVHAGADHTDICGMFNGAPDYDQKITSYQIQNIASTGYKVPSCRWVAAHGLCPGCNATHPTQYKA